MYLSCCLAQLRCLRNRYKAKDGTKGEWSEIGQGGREGGKDGRKDRRKGGREGKRKKMEISLKVVRVENAGLAADLHFLHAKENV